MAVRADVTDLWVEYKSTSSHQLRNDLVVHYTSLVRYVASKVAVGLPSTVDTNDLVSYGIFGLIDAIEKFDLDKGVKFETYAITRIRGSIFDELRTLDWVPRSIRSRAREVETTYAEMEAELSRVPEEHEVAQRMGLTIQELWILLSQTANTQVGTLDETVSDERLQARDVLADAGADPEGLQVAEEIKGMLADAVMVMPERSRVILVLYYLEEMTLAEIGALLGVTESRVCQLQSKLLAGLRANFSGATSLVA